MKLFRKIWSGISTAILCLALILAFLLVGVKLFGIDVYTVLSPSMEPHFLTGSVIYVVDAEPQELQKGDVITYRLSGSTNATHRIVEVLNEDGQLSFRTKGDNNDIADANPVRADAVIGKAVFSIPLLGYFISIIQHPRWRFVAIAVGGLLLLLMLLPELLFDDKKTKKAKENIEKDSDQAEKIQAKEGNEHEEDS